MLALVLACLPAMAAKANKPKCELDRPIRMSGLDWDSDRFHVAVASFIMEKGYGCKTEVIPGSTIPMITGLIKGSLDIMMEVWKENTAEIWDKGEKAGKIKFLAINFPDAVQGWFVPRYLVEGENAPAKGLKKVTDLPKYKHLFKDPEEPDRGRFYNCIYGWSCEKINSTKLTAYGLDKHFTNFRPGISAALSAGIAAAYKRKKPILYYYWGPSWVIEKYDGVMLQEPPFDPEIWAALRKGSTAKATAYPLTKVYSGAHVDFIKAAPKLVAFLKNYRTTNKLISEALVYLQEKEGATAHDAAMNFLKTKEDIWTKWVPEEIAARVKAALT